MWWCDPLEAWSLKVSTHWNITTGSTISSTREECIHCSLCTWFLQREWPWVRSWCAAVTLRYSKSQIPTCGQSCQYICTKRAWALHKQRSWFYECEIMIRRMLELYCTSISPLNIQYCRPAHNFGLNFEIVRFCNFIFDTNVLIVKVSAMVEVWQVLAQPVNPIYCTIGRCNLQKHWT